MKAIMLVIAIVIAILFSLRLLGLGAEFIEETDIFKRQPGYWAGEMITGTTTDSYPSTAQGEWSVCGRFGIKTIKIVNTGTTNSLTYTVKWRITPDGLFHDYPGHKDIAIAANATGDAAAIINFTDNCDKVDIFVKSTTSGQATTFRLEVGGRS